MSRKDQMKWDDNLDFESLADEHEPGLTNDFPAADEGDLQDLSYDAEPLGEPAEAATGEEDADEAAAPVQGSASAPRRRARRRHGIPALGMGLLFGFATVVSAVGLTAAALLVTGTDPRSFWNPQALLQVQPWLDLQNHPLNLFYLVAVGIVALTWLIAWRVLNFSRGVNRNLRDAENLLERVADLRLGNDTAWQHPAFKSDPALEAFVVETLGAWRLQVARQDKNVALEGELRRLDQAAGSGQRSHVDGRYEHPLVGHLADLFLRAIDAKASAEQEIEAVRSKDQHESGSILGVIQDARSWNRHTLDQLSVQASTVARVAGNLEEARASAAGQSNAGGATAQVSLSLRELKSEIEALAAAEKKAHVPGSRSVAEQLTELTERGGKLAFQIAMEVASLGERGERLLPMAQALEELTTEFRESAQRLAGDGKSVMPRYPEMVRKLDGLIGLLDSTPAQKPSALEARAADLSQIARRASNDLELLAGSFNHQSARLNELGSSFARLTGQSFDPGDLRAGRPDNPPAGTLELSQMDPFALEPAAPTPRNEIDPFATADSVLDIGGSQSFDLDFSNDVTPQAAAPAPAAARSASGPREFKLEPSAPADPFGGFGDVGREAELSPAGETVYDLSEFDARPLDEQDGGAEPRERIYDLAEFGAEALI